MTDHVARMVNRWFDRAQQASENPEAIAHELVDAVHRMIREAEDEMRRRCEEVARSVAPPDLGSQIALAIRTATRGESLPRRSLIDAYAESSSGH